MVWSSVVGGVHQDLRHGEHTDEQCRPAQGAFQGDRTEGEDCYQPDREKSPAHERRVLAYRSTDSREGCGETLADLHESGIDRPANAHGGARVPAEPTEDYYHCTEQQ